jgi:multicomponent Na+:H+ antiporter subunit B
MKSVILETAARYLLPLLLLFSVFILLRGHYLPGGGFVGGLLAAIALVLHSFAYGLDSTRNFIRIHPGLLIPVGLLFALISALSPLLVGKPIMTGLWLSQKIPVLGIIGTPLLFDIGVFLVVIGVALTVLFTISEEI